MEKPDHLGLAALKLAVGEDTGLFSEMYAEVTENRSQYQKMS